MPGSFELTPRPVRPGRLLLLALAMTFIGEYGIMKLLPWILPPGNGDSFESVVDACLLTLLVTPILWLLAVRPIQRLAQSRMHFLKRALTAQEEERRRITQDLHDGLGQSLTSLMVGLRAMEEMTHDEPVRELTKELRKIGAGLHDDLRRIVKGLRSVILDQLGLIPAIERLIEEMHYPGCPAVESSSTQLDGVRLDPEIEATAFRIVQEALSNALRHASASLVRVSFAACGRTLVIEVADDGVGFDPALLFSSESGGGYGLLSIRERAMIAGGSAEIVSHPQAGTTVTVRLPFRLRRPSHA